MSCQECCSWCCPCLDFSEKDSKFPYEYTPSVPVPNMPQDCESVPPERVFEFPQEKCDFNTHPPMFVEPPPEIVTEQPAVKHSRSVSVDDNAHSRKIQGSPRSLSVPYTSSHSDKTTRGRSATLPVGSTLSSIPSDGDDNEGEAVILPRFRRESSSETGPQSRPFALPMLEESCIQVEDKAPVLQFSLLYDVQRSILTVHLQHASNLPAKDRGGTSDPFVIMYMMPNKEEVYESSVISRTLNPVFEQSFEFHRQLPDGIRQQTLVFRVYDHDRFSRNDLIGSVVFPLEGADLFGVVMRMQIDETPNLSIEERNSQGDILLALCYDSIHSTTIKGVVLKATNLRKKDFFGLADPYIKIYLYHNNKRISKWRSSVKRRTLIPIFNESFLFEVPEGDIDNIYLNVIVMDYDRFTKNDPMGQVLLGSNVDDPAGCKHWKETIRNPNSSISQWHVLKPV